MSDSAAPTRTTRATLGVVFLTVFLDLLGFGLIIPIQAFYAESLGARPAVVTLLGASYSLMQFLFMPFWGRLSDRIGRRPVMLSSVALSCAGFALFGLAGSLPMLFAARMLAGFGNANIGVAQAVIADTTSPQDRAKGMGMVGMAFGLGFVIGPAVGGTLGQWGMAVPAFAAAGLAAINWVSAWFFLPETRDPNRTVDIRHRNEVRRAILQLPSVRRLMLLSLVVVTGFAIMEQATALFVERTWVPEALVPATAEAGHKRAAMLTAYVLLSVGVTMAVVQGGLIGKLSRRFGEVPLIRCGTVLMAIGLVAMPLLGESGSFGLLLANNALLAVGSGMTTPSLTGLLSRAVGADQQGAALGLGQSASALGRVIGPAVAGALLEWGTRVPFWVGALLVASGAIVAMGLRQPSSHGVAHGA
jgi:DHA1 family tetracycline resistance protein-like MFS transporter